MNMFKSKSSKSKSKPVKVGGSSSSTAPSEKSDKKPKLDEFIKNRDYTGAICLLEFQRQTGESTEKTLPWLGYSAFHLGDYKKALDVYLDLGKQNPIYYLYASCCEFYLGDYKSAEELAEKGVNQSTGESPDPLLQNRLLFHISHKQNDETKLMKYHSRITDSTEDQLSLASIHYLRNHFQEATDIYKRLLIEYRDYLALQVYVSMCYYKLDYYDVSLEILAPYLIAYPDSAIAINLKACNHYKLYDGKAAESELKVMIDLLALSPTHNFENDLVRHNLVVFRNGENALQVLPPLIHSVPEARLNFVIYHLRQGEVYEAHELIKDLEPTTPQEYILKGVVNASLGQIQEQQQQSGSGAPIPNTGTSPREHLKLAQQYFQLVGASASECDTIPGRQSMASCFFLLKQFEDVLIYLNSVKAYSYSDSIFNYNYGQTLASTESYAEGEEAFLQVTNEQYKSEYIFLSWLARCYIYNGKAREAWELYLKMESNTDSFSMLVLIANDCYKVGAFYYSAKAFDVLERLDPSNEYWEGKRGACCGVFQLIIARKEKKEYLRDIVMMLRNNTNSPQSEFMVRVMKKWAQENGVQMGNDGNGGARM